MPAGTPADDLKIAALVLAAGRSSRFEGGHKLLAPLGGIPLIRHVMNEVSASPLAGIVLVVSPEGNKIASAAGPGRWRIAVNGDAAQGLATSIQAGLASLPENTGAAAIVLADMPGVTAGLITRLAAAARENPGAIVHPAGPSGAQGHPVIWPADLFEKLMKLHGDKGAKALLKDYASRVVTVLVDEPAPFTDIDTRADLAAFERLRRQ